MLDTDVHGVPLDGYTRRKFKIWPPGHVVSPLQVLSMCSLVPSWLNWLSIFCVHWDFAFFSSLRAVLLS